MTNSENHEGSVPDFGEESGVDLQASWDAELAAAGFSFVSGQLRNASYLAEEFPRAVDLDEVAESVIFTSPISGRIDAVRNFMVREGITPASPQHAPASARILRGHASVFIPQEAVSEDGYGRRQMAMLSRGDEGCMFGIDRYFAGKEWNVGNKFLGVRKRT